MISSRCPPGRLNFCNAATAAAIVGPAAAH